MRTFPTLALIAALATAPLAVASAAEMKPKPESAAMSSGTAMKPADNAMKADDKMMKPGEAMTKPGGAAMTPGTAMQGPPGGSTGSAMMKK